MDEKLAALEKSKDVRKWKKLKRVIKNQKQAAMNQKVMEILAKAFVLDSAYRRGMFQDAVMDNLVTMQGDPRASEVDYLDLVQAVTNATCKTYWESNCWINWKDLRF